jgi:hypothetical protein
MWNLAKCQYVFIGVPESHENCKGMSSGFV